MLGISVNSEAANRRFAQKLALDFPLLCDTRRSVSKAYGVLNPLLRVAKRVTFVIDKEGVIRHTEMGAASVDPSGAYRVSSQLG